MNTKSQTQRAKAAFTVTVVSVLAISQIGSFLVNSYLAADETYVVNSIIHFTHVRNFGGVFGLFPGHTMVFAVIASVILLGLTAYLGSGKTADTFQYICFGLIVGAGASNVGDRFLYGSVVDFIDIQSIPYWHYVFNTADVVIHLGAWPLVIQHFVTPNVGVGRQLTNVRK